MTAIPVWSLGERLAKALDHAGITREEMADALDVHPNTVNNWIAGRSHPKRPAVVVWAQITGVDVDWLAKGDIPPERQIGATSAPGDKTSPRRTPRSPRAVRGAVASRRTSEGKDAPDPEIQCQG